MGACAADARIYFRRAFVPPLSVFRSEAPAQEFFVMDRPDLSWKRLRRGGRTVEGKTRSAALD